MQGVWCLSSLNIDSWYDPSDLPGGGRGAIRYWAPLKEQLSTTAWAKAEWSVGLQTGKKNLCYNPTTCIPQNHNIQKKNHIVTTTCRSPEQKRLLKTWTFHLCCLHLPGCRTLPWARYARLRRPWQGLGLQKDLLSCPTQFRYVWLYDSTTHTCWTQIILSDWKFLKVLRTISIISFQMNSPLSPWLEVFSPIIAPQRWVRFWKGPL